MNNIDVNKLVTQLRLRINELEYDAIVKGVYIEQLQEQIRQKEAELRESKVKSEKESTKFAIREPDEKGNE